MSERDALIQEKQNAKQLFDSKRFALDRDYRVLNKAYLPLGGTTALRTLNEFAEGGDAEGIATLFAKKGYISDKQILNFSNWLIDASRRNNLDPQYTALVAKRLLEDNKDWATGFKQFFSGDEEFDDKTIFDGDTWSDFKGMCTDVKEKINDFENARMVVKNLDTVRDAHKQAYDNFINGVDRVITATNKANNMSGPYGEMARAIANRQNQQYLNALDNDLYDAEQMVDSVRTQVQPVINNETAKQAVRELSKPYGSNNIPSNFIPGQTTFEDFNRDREKNIDNAYAQALAADMINLNPLSNYSVTNSPLTISGSNPTTNSNSPLNVSDYTNGFIRSLNESSTNSTESEANTKSTNTDLNPLIKPFVDNYNAVVDNGRTAEAVDNIAKAVSGATQPIKDQLQQNIEDNGYIQDSEGNFYNSKGTKFPDKIAEKIRKNIALEEQKAFNRQQQNAIKNVLTASTVSNALRQAATNPLSVATEPVSESNTRALVNLLISSGQ